MKCCYSWRHGIPPTTVSLYVAVCSMAISTSTCRSHPTAHDRTMVALLPSLLAELCAVSFLHHGSSPRSSLSLLLWQVVDRPSSTCCCTAVSHGVTAHLYADDTQLYIHCKTQQCATEDSRLMSCIEELDTWMTSNWLRLNSDKTQLIWVGSRQQLDNVTVTEILLDGHSITTSNNVTCLFTWPELKWIKLSNNYTTALFGQSYLLQCYGLTWDDVEIVCANECANLHRPIRHLPDHT